MIGDRLAVGHLALNQEAEVRPLLPELRARQLMRWGLCWHGRAALNRRDAGSIPAAAAYGRHPAG